MILMDMNQVFTDVSAQRLAPAVATLVLLGFVVVICWNVPGPAARVLRWFILGTVASTVVGLTIAGIAHG